MKRCTQHPHDAVESSSGQADVHKLTASTRCAVVVAHSFQHCMTTDVSTAGAPVDDRILSAPLRLTTAAGQSVGIAGKECHMLLDGLAALVYHAV